MRGSDRYKLIRQKVIERDGKQCCYCEEFLLLEEVTMEHIVPLWKKGSTNATNLTVACHDCNNARGSKDFFRYCKRFKWSEAKLQKYRNLYEANLKIKILNISKEFCIEDPDNVIPESIIKAACDIMHIDVERLDIESFKKYFILFDISIYKTYQRAQIKNSFEKIIQIIESETM